MALLRTAVSLRAAPVNAARCSFTTAQLINNHAANNVTANVAAHVGKGLLQRPGHPLQIIKTLIRSYFDEQHTDASGRPLFALFDSLSPVVTVRQCFDDLLIPPEHVSRRPSDTYYIDAEHVLRTHTSAHQCDLMRAGHSAFLCAGDVYRRDSIDSSHYTAFHQMEGVRLGLSPGVVEEDLKETLAGMVRTLFGDVRMRWVEAYFPFTDPSLELEIHFNGEWLEVLGCGVVHRRILENCGLEDTHGWAFGLGLERLAMVLFQVPDIRLFWTEDERFLSQFRDGEISTFVPYSKYSACFKDYSFWLPSGLEADEADPVVWENDVCDVMRSVAGDLVEKVELLDEYARDGRTSRCYRVSFNALDRQLTNEEIVRLQDHIRSDLVEHLGVEMR